MTRFNKFLTEEENDLNSRFLNEGYILTDILDRDNLTRIHNKIVEITSDYFGDSIGDRSRYLDQIHNRISVSKLNHFRLHVFHQINGEEWFREVYYKLAKYLLDIIVGNELAMQLRVNLSIQLPNDDSSLLPVHADVWSGDSPFEVVVWLPLVDCYGSKTMYLLPPSSTKKLHENSNELIGKSSEDLYRLIEKDLHWIEISFGQIMIFNQNLPHGNRVNDEDETRWSMNCRFKSVFSPYADKKLGEFFEPITLRAASQVGMDYELPGTNNQLR